MTLKSSQPGTQPTSVPTSEAVGEHKLPPNTLVLVPVMAEGLSSGVIAEDSCLPWLLAQLYSLFGEISKPTLLDSTELCNL